MSKTPENTNRSRRNQADSKWSYTEPKEEAALEYVAQKKHERQQEVETDDEERTNTQKFDSVRSEKPGKKESNKAVWAFMITHMMWDHDL